jgi:arylsulfatase A-like enzyme
MAAWAALAGAAAALLAGCAAPPRPSIVLITIDTLRADHLGCYGYRRPVSPRIDALALQSTLFEQARTTLPRTTQSISSILTGRLPKSHGARGLFAHLSESNTTLAEVLRKEGFATAAVVSNTFLHPRQGFAQGFDTYDNPEERWSGDSAPGVTRGAVRWLDAHRGDRTPFFLWVHYVDPHWLYAPPRPWDTAFGGEPGGRLPLYDEVAAGRVTEGQIDFGHGVDAAQAERLVDLYDGEIGYTDAAVGALLDRLAAIEDPLMTILTADHGEALGEHGYRGHGEFLYEDGLRIPLLVRYPGVVAAGARERGAALNIDIAPTILALAGLGGLDGVEGRALMTTAGPGGAAKASGGREVTWAETDYQLIHRENPRYYIPGPRGRWNAASDGRYKLIHIPRPGGEFLELYDLEADPGETVNRAADPALAPVRARLMRDVLEFADYSPSAGSPATPSTRDTEGDDSDPTRDLSPDEIERLRSLGYIN